jgi:hypothetical protein
MTDSEQNIAIAKVCRWTNIHEFLGVLIGTDPKGNERALEDWTTSLNAMHEAEKVLSNDQLVDYCANLRKIVDKFWNLLGVQAGFECYFTATSQQRAEAFLRTLGLWTD